MRPCEQGCQQRRTCSGHTLARGDVWRHSVYRTSMAAPTTVTLPTAADVDAAAARIKGVAIRTPLFNFAGARRAARRAGVPQGRDAAAHRLVQVPRRLQQDFADPAGEAAPAAWWPIRPAITRRAWRTAATLCGVPAAIVMPSDAPLPKRERTAAFGAEVVLYDRDARGPRRHRARARARSAARRWCRRSTIR